MIYIPFLVLDMSLPPFKAMAMMMLPPVVISLPSS